MTDFFAAASSSTSIKLTEKSYPLQHEGKVVTPKIEKTVTRNVKEAETKFNGELVNSEFMMYSAIFVAVLIFFSVLNI